MFFFCFSSCFLLLANDFYLFRSSLFFSGTRRAMVAGDDHNGPKRRQMHRLKLGLRYVFFFPHVFSLLTNDFYFDLGSHYVLKAPKELRWAAATISYNRPKRRIWRRLGLRYVFLLFFFVFSLY